MLLPGRLEHGRVTAESTLAKDVGISDASHYIGGRRCSDRLNLPLLSNSQSFTLSVGNIGASQMQKRQLVLRFEILQALKVVSAWV